MDAVVYTTDEKILLIESNNYAARAFKSTVRDGRSISTSRVSYAYQAGVKSSVDTAFDAVVKDLLLRLNPDGESGGFYSAGTGIDITLSKISMSHLGLEVLTDPGVDKMIYWNNAASSLQWVESSVGVYGFKTINGITNDVVADSLGDILTLASGNDILGIVGTTATDTITFTIDETKISHDNILDVSSDDHHNEVHALETAGPHSGSLPLTDLTDGAAGDIITRQAADWAVLNGGTEGYVLTMGATYPEWAATSCSLINETEDELVTCTANANELTGEANLTFTGAHFYANATGEFTGTVIGAAPTLGTHLATKTYVDGVASGLQIKESCRLATTADITIATALNNGDPLDGETLVTGDRIFVKDQADLTENGIYVVAVAPIRATDANSWAELVTAYAWVEEGDVNAGSSWVCDIAAGGAEWTDDIPVIMFSNSGAGVSVSGVPVDNQIAVWTNVDTIEGTNDLVFTATGLGVGTATPGYLFQAEKSSATDYVLVDFRNTSADAGAYANIYLGNNAATPYLQFRTSRVTGHADIGNPAEQDLNFFTNGVANTRMTIKDDGSVGIGITSSSNPLHVYHATRNTIAKFESGDASAYLSLMDSGTTGSGYLVSRQGNTVYFYTDDVARLTLLTGGNVGILNATPSYGLDVNATGRFTSTFYLSGIAATAANEWDSVLWWDSAAGKVTQTASGGGTDNFLRADGVWTNPTTPAALTKTDDTNVTLTLGGTPLTALLAATSLTLGWTGTLADGRIASATDWNTAFGWGDWSGEGFVNAAGAVSAVAAADNYLKNYANDTSTHIITALDFKLSSDIKLKKNINPYIDGFNKALQFKPITYEWRDIEKSGVQLGFIAQDVRKIESSLVAEDENGFLAISYPKITVINNAAIHRLNDKIEYLEKRITELENERS